ncbi:MAG: DUF2079 domain-containing protein [Actinomycetota bacterium]|nr:DUF2079 domain-containing protein [Actinomycetota bacterium]
MTGRDRAGGAGPSLGALAGATTASVTTVEPATAVEPKASEEVESADAPGEGDTDDDRGRHNAVRRAREWVDRRLRAVTPWQLMLVGMVAAYTTYFTKLSLDIHHGLGTSSYDSGLYDQGIWLMSRFQAPFVTLMGRNLMGDHTSFILVGLVPLYWLFPAAGTMFFAQSLAIGAGAVPVFLYARKWLASEAMAFVLAAVYLLHPAVGWTNLENFHPDAFLGVLVGFAIYAALERRWRMYVVFVVLSLLVKEDVSLIIVPLGIWVALRRDRRIGLLTIVGSLGMMAVAMLLVMRSLIGVPTRNAWRVPFGGPGGLLRTTFERPGEVVDHLRSDGRPWYVWQMLTPFAWLMIRAPEVALIGGGVLVTNVVSTFWYQYHVQYHYSLVIVPALALGTVYVIGKVREHARRWVVTGLAVVAMYTAFLWGPLPFARNDLAYWAPDHPVAEQLRDILDAVPGDAVVAAHYGVTPHMAHRSEIYQFPTPFRVVLYGPDISLEGSRLDELAERVEYVVLSRAKDEEMQRDWDVVDDAFELVASNESWEVFRRDPDTPLPPLPPPTS